MKGRDMAGAVLGTIFVFVLGIGVGFRIATWQPEWEEVSEEESRLECSEDGQCILEFRPGDRVLVRSVKQSEDYKSLETRVAKLEESRKGCCEDNGSRQGHHGIRPSPPPKQEPKGPRIRWTDRLQPSAPLPPSPSGCLDKGKGPCGCAEAKVLREKPKGWYYETLFP